MRFRRTLLLLAALPLALPLALPAGAAVAAGAAPVVPTLVDIRAARHDGYDRLVFEFSGGLPGSRDVRYVDEILGDASGEPVAVAGNALLRVLLTPAAGHDASGAGTYGPVRRSFALPVIVEVVNAGDFESVMTFGVGLSRSVPFRVSTLTAPARLVIDLDTSRRAAAFGACSAIGADPLPRAIAGGAPGHFRPSHRPVVIRSADGTITYCPPSTR